MIIQVVVFEMRSGMNVIIAFLALLRQRYKCDDHIHSFNIYIFLLKFGVIFTKLFWTCAVMLP